MLLNLHTARQCVTSSYPAPSGPAKIVGPRLFHWDRNEQSLRSISAPQISTPTVFNREIISTNRESVLLVSLIFLRKFYGMILLERSNAVNVKQYKFPDRNKSCGQEYRGLALKPTMICLCRRHGRENALTLKCLTDARALLCLWHSKIRARGENP
jgi:hypothetical protein